MSNLILFGRAGKASASYRRRNYYLFDTFATDRAAGAVNGSLAEPTGGARTVADANGKITITDGLLNFATGGVANDWVYWAGLAHAAGRRFILDVSTLGASSSMSFGLDANTVGASIRNAMGLTPTVLNTSIAAWLTIAWTVTNVAHRLCIIQRSTGYHYLALGGVFREWTLVSSSIVDSFLEMPEIQILNTTTVFSAGAPRMPKQPYTIIPLESDSFTATTTDGAGNLEANGPVGRAYTDIGTWGVSAGKASCSALSGGLGFHYLPTTTPDVNIEVNLVRSAGVCGIVARYVDANNYLIAYHDGTNAKLDQVVAGVATNLLSQARTYVAGATLQLFLQGTGARLKYNNTAVVGTQATVPASTSANHGMYTTDTGNTFDKFIAWARGSEGQYIGIDISPVTEFSILGDSISNTYPDWPYVFNNLTTIYRINNHAVAGETIVSHLAAQATAAASDNANTIIIHMGTNDDNAGNMTTLQQKVEDAITALRASNPSATIYFMNVLPRWTDTGGATPVDKSNIRTAIAAACTAQGITCWDTFTTPWITSVQTSDGLHPAEAGSRVIAAEVLSRI